ncbi:MAG: hypothetical protein J6B86_06555 [Clostridia bacterium]|nr:hypothetical protein [Clostridia bacterium]
MGLDLPFFDYETDERSSTGKTHKRRRGRMKRRGFWRSGLNFQGGSALRRKFKVIAARNNFFGKINRKRHNYTL